MTYSEAVLVAQIKPALPFAAQYLQLVTEIMIVKISH